MTLQKQTLFAISILLMVTLSAWSPSKPIKHSHPNSITSGDSTLPYAFKLHLAKVDVAAINSRHSFLAKPAIRMNSNAVKFVQQFLKKNREDLAETVLRSQKLFPAMEAIFEKQDLPKQLKYLAVVESDLKVKARSNAGAIGYWQLMKETAIELGLNVNGKTDDRKHLWRSTNAAAKYLKALYKEYDDWLLVIAAYNSGPGTINKAIKASGSRNFWRLQSYLPAETRGHVKRFIAIHYFFDDAGSETTLTKTERLIYEREMDRYNKLLQEENRSIDSTTSQPEIIKEDKFP